MKLRAKNLLSAAILMSLTGAACAGNTNGSAQRPVAREIEPVVVTSAELADGFKNRGECEAALGGGRGKAQLLGSAFNRAHGNISRCEKVDGEYHLVVYPPHPDNRRTD